ncbi:MAG: hypothetical protein ACT4NY_20255 [Pseudonocardiales bacterium]
MHGPRGLAGEVGAVADQDHWPRNGPTTGPANCSTPSMTIRIPHTGRGSTRTGSLSARRRVGWSWGDYHGAAQIVQDAIADFPGRYRRTYGVCLARTPLAQACDHEVEHAATLGLEALPIGVQTGSARTLTTLAQLNNQLAPWNTVPAVADFCTAMQDTILHRA